MSDKTELKVIEMDSEIRQVDSQPVTPMSLVQIAVEQGADIDKLEKLMAMQERWEANEARKAFNVAVSTFRAGCPSIQKTRAAHNSKYAGLAETISQIKSLMESCGLSHSWRTEQTGSAVSVTCKLTHVMGHSEETTLTAEPDKSGSKNSIQAIGSSVTYLQRYTLFSILGIASTDQDDDGAGASTERITDDQALEIEGIIDERKKNKAKFLEYFKISNVCELPSDQFGRAMSALKK